MFNPCTGHERENLFWILADFEHYIKVYGVAYIMSQLSKDINTSFEEYYNGVKKIQEKTEVPALLKNI